jgi:hypothetical protein
MHLRPATDTLPAGQAAQAARSAVRLVSFRPDSDAVRSTALLLAAQRPWRVESRGGGAGRATRGRAARRPGAAARLGCWPRRRAGPRAAGVEKSPLTAGSVKLGILRVVDGREGTLMSRLGSARAMHLWGMGGGMQGRVWRGEAKKGAPLARRHPHSSAAAITHLGWHAPQLWGTHSWPGHLPLQTSQRHVTRGLPSRQLRGRILKSWSSAARAAACSEALAPSRVAA